MNQMHYQMLDQMHDQMPDQMPDQIPDQVPDQMRDSKSLYILGINSDADPIWFVWSMFEVQQSLSAS